MMINNLFDILLKKKDSTDVALICNQEHISYQELYNAAKLEADKCNIHNKVVGVRTQNNIVTVIKLFSLWKNNNMIVFLNPKLNISECEAILNYCKADLFINISTNSNLNIVEYQNKKHTYYDKDVAVVIPTSGTTNKSKLIKISHNALLNGMICTSRFSKRDIKSKDLIILSLATRTALEGQLLTGLYIGESIILYNGNLNVRVLLNTLNEHSISHINLVPTLLNLVLNYLEKRELCIECLKNVILVGERISPLIINKFYMYFIGTSLLYGYGLTETGPISFGTMNPEKNNTFVGNLNDFPEVFVKEKSCSDNISEILVQSNMVMDGYLGIDDVFEDGWFATGDIGRVSENKDLMITGRIKNIINYAGQKIFPEEVEDILMQSGYIDDVCVTNENDSLSGEIVVANVVLKENITIDEKQIIGLCKGKLADYKIPQKIYFTESLKNNKNGKKVRYNKKNN